jgi:hypothetical protein
MRDYFLTQTAKCIVASAADFIKSGRTTPSVRIEGRWDEVMASQRPYDVATAAVPHTVELLNSLSLEDRTASLLSLFQTDPQYECAIHFTKRTIFYSPITLAVYIKNAWRDRITKSW